MVRLEEKGITGLVVGHPLDTIKVRQQAFGDSIITATRRTFKHEGIRGFFKGMLFPLLTVGPVNALLFGIYGNTMKFLEKSDTQTHKISYHDGTQICRVMLAGTFAGIFQTLLLCPIEVIKTGQQARTGGKGSWQKHYELPYRGSLHAAAGIFKDRGFKGFFRGLGPLLIRDVPTSGLYVLTYELLMYSNFSQCKTPMFIKQSVAGGFAGVMSWIFVFPIDVIKSKIQTDDLMNPEYKGMVDCAKKLYQKEGYQVFFRGLPVLLIRTFPVNAAIFLGYEAVLYQSRKEK